MGIGGIGKGPFGVWIAVEIGGPRLGGSNQGGGIGTESPPPGSEGSVIWRCGSLPPLSDQGTQTFHGDNA